MKIWSLNVRHKMYVKWSMDKITRGGGEGGRKTLRQKYTRIKSQSLLYTEAFRNFNQNKYPDIFSSLGSGELLSPLVVRRLSSFRLSVNFSHFNQLLWSHWANLNQTLVEWSLDGTLPKLCPVILTSNQDGRQAKNRTNGGWNFNCPLLL